MEICAYLESIAKNIPSPRTIANHVSHLRTYFRKAQVPTTALDNWRVRWAMNGFNRDKSYVPRVKAAFPASSLQQTVSLLQDHGNQLLVKVSVLLMYYAALRQSEVLPNTSASYDRRYHLSRRDVVISDDSVKVFIKHAKNLQTIYQTKSVVLRSSPNPSVCIVAALSRMYQLIPTLSPDDACIVFKDTRRPVTTEYVRRHWSAHLKANGVDTTALSLHSLRKAAATEAHNQGCNELDIQRYGGWRSNSHRAYITTSQATVNQAVIRALNQ